MFTVLFTFLRAHWQTTIIASLIFSVTAVFSVQWLEIHHLRARITQCHMENITLEESNKALIASIRDQNTAISMLQVSMRQRKNRAAQLLSLAKRTAAQHDRKAEGIKAASLADDCASLHVLLDDYVAIPKK